MIKHKHKIFIEKDGTKRMNDNGYWECECGATIFPNCDWTPAENKLQKAELNFLKYLLEYLKEAYK